jgi:hypothetical protein
MVSKPFILMVFLIVCLPLVVGLEVGTITSTGLGGGYNTTINNTDGFLNVTRTEQNYTININRSLFDEVYLDDVSYTAGNLLTLTGTEFDVDGDAVNGSVDTIITKRQYNLTANYSNSSGDADTVDDFHAAHLLKSNETDTFEGDQLTVNNNLSVVSGSFLVEKQQYGHAHYAFNSGISNVDMFNILSNGNRNTFALTASGWSTSSRSAALIFNNINNGNGSGWSEGNIGITGASIGDGRVNAGATFEVQKAWDQMFGVVARVITNSANGAHLVQNGMYGMYSEVEVYGSNSTAYGFYGSINSESPSYSTLYGLFLTATNTPNTDTYGTHVGGFDYGLYIQTANNYSIYAENGPAHINDDISTNSDLVATLNTLSSCGWEGNATFGHICADGKIMAGYNMTTQELYCCEI